MAKSTIKLYGNISQWNYNSAEDMVARLDEAAKISDEVDIHIHSYGGSVIEGNVICNAIKKCNKKVNAYIDGIAASMSSIVAMYATKIYMSENAFLMIHAPAGMTEGRGTIQEHQTTIKILTAMERNFLKALMARSSKDENTVKQWLESDTWFSAEEALAMGLIDGIVDPVAKDVDRLTIETATAVSVEAAYNQYTAALTAADTQKPINSNPKNQMNKELLIKTMGLTGVTADSSEAEIEAALIASHNANQQAVTAANAKIKSQHDAQITAAINAFKGKITTEQETSFREIGEKCGIETMQAALKPLSEQRSFSDMIAGVTTAGASTSSTSWDFDAWQKNDPVGLDKMSKDNYDAFNALYMAKFGANAPK